jgi:hypothetical protein
MVGVESDGLDDQYVRQMRCYCFASKSWFSCLAVKKEQQTSNGTGGTRRSKDDYAWRERVEQERRSAWTEREATAQKTHIVAS